MRIKILIIVCLSIGPMTFLNAQSSLTVEIIKLESNKGVVIVDLLDQNEKSVADQTCKITNNKCTLIFKGLMNGLYAIRYFHDENES